MGTSFSNYPCQYCSQVTITLNQCSVGVQITDTPVSCNITYEIGAEGNVASTTVFPQLQNNDKRLLYPLEYNVNSSCDGLLANNTTFVEVNTNLGLAVAGPVNSGGFVEYLRIRSTTAGNIDIPLAPGTAVLSGAGGTISNSNDLIYNPGSPATMASALLRATRNYLGTLGYNLGSDYSINTTSVSSSEVKIFFVCQNTTSGEWLGTSRVHSEISVDTDGDGLNVQVHTNIEDTQGSNSSGLRFNFDDLQNYGSFLCSDTSIGMSLTINTAEPLDFAACDYDTLVLNGTAGTLDAFGTVFPDCDYIELTADVTSCNDTISYDWNTGDTTASIDVLSGNYSVTVDCPDSSCQASDSISV